MNKPIYSYNERKVETRLVQAFRKRGSEATVADLIGATSLPRLQIEEMLPRIVQDYRGHLRVTESGEILYYFPHGVHHRERSTKARIQRGLRRFARGAAAVGRVLFKVWIMLMLVGYFVLFIALVIAALLASAAASAKSEGRSRGRGGLGGTYMLTRLVQQIIFLWMFSGRRNQYGAYGNRMSPQGRMHVEEMSFRKMRSQGDGPPLHQSVFAFVFGSEDPTKEWETRERQAFIQLVQTHKGVVTLEELRALTGRSLDDAQDLMNSMMLEYDGEPDVTEAGSLIYRFPELLRTAQPSDRRGGSLGKLLPEMPTIPFNTNTPALNRWIAVLNGVNLGFGSYFTVFGFMGGLPEEGFGLFYSIVVTMAAEILAAPFTVVLIGLGFVPLLFSLLFYLIPLIRSRRLKARNASIKSRNARRAVFQEVLNTVSSGTEVVDAQDIVHSADNSREKTALLSAFEELAAEQHADVGTEVPMDAGEPGFTATGADGEGYQYRFTELRRQLQDVERYRDSIDLERYRTGEVVFDSNE
ncbi:MAG: hypothetical protein ACOCVC_05625 [Spirochaeta sp.]